MRWTEIQTTTVRRDAVAYGLALALAPERARGRYMALLSLGGSLAFTVAPALFTFLLTVNSSFFWLMLAGITTAAALGVLLLERSLPPHSLRPARQEPEAEESEQLVVE